MQCSAVQCSAAQCSAVQRSAGNTAGNTVTPKRARLSPESVEELVIVNCNVGLLKELGIRS